MLAVLAPALLLGGCGNSRLQPTGLGKVSGSPDLVAYVSPKQGISFGHPSTWTVTNGRRPLLARIGQGDAIASIYLYERSDLPVDAAGIEEARTKLLDSLKRRAPGFKVESSAITEINGVPAVEIRGSGKVGSRRVKTLAVHIYKPHGEYVVDAYAAPNVYDRAEKVAFEPLLQTLRVRDPVPESSG
jgi:hypothetical protein